MTERGDQNKFNDLKLSRDTISASNFLRREKNALLFFSMKDSALPDTTVILLSFTVCFHPVLSVNSTIRSCLFLFCCMFSISAYKQLLLSGKTKKQREAVSIDMIKLGNIPPIHSFNDPTTPLSNKRHKTRKNHCEYECVLFQEKLSSHFLLLLLILSMCLSFYCNLLYA